jgi:guanylate kinase
MQGIILYGPPASGKDTITLALSALDSRYVLFPRFKVGGGRTAGYRIATPEAVNELRADGAIVWENHRYGATYVIDRPSLAEHLRTHIPVVHLGQRAAVEAIREATPGAHWFSIWLWCPRDIAKQRITARSTGDSDERMRVWDETYPLVNCDLRIDTAKVAPVAAAAAIHELAANAQEFA